MTVSELIEQLKNYPGDMRVLTLGGISWPSGLYEGGYNDVGLKIEEIVFDFSQNNAWYYGPHACVKFTDEKVGTPCLIIGRGK